MKTGKITLIVSAILLLAGTAFCTESESSGSRTYLGVLLDAAPLPELLSKHLDLSPGQGVRIRNIQKNSPAEEAGLERDDIIISIEDKEVYDSKSIVETVHTKEVGTELSLEIIHLGKHKTVKIKLRASKDQPDWKYPLEPEIEQLWRPGKIFRMSPEDQDWVEILMDELPSELNINKLFKKFYTTYNIDGNSITIEGNPNNEDSKIIIRDGDAKFETTAKEIDKLPEKYRDAAERALKKALKIKDNDIFWDSDSIQQPEDLMDNLSIRLRPQHWPPKPQPEQDGRMLGNIQEQMSQLMERIKELEKSQSELLDRLSEKKQM